MSNNMQPSQLDLSSIYPQFTHVANQPTNNEISLCSACTVSCELGVKQPNVWKMWAALQFSNVQYLAHIQYIDHFVNDNIYVS